MAKFQARTAVPGDAANYVEWLRESPGFPDSEVYGYPTCNTIVVERDGIPVLIDSFHIIIVVDSAFKVRGFPMVEALAVRPGLSKAHTICALMEFHDAMKRVCVGMGLREFWCQTADETFANILTHYGLVKLNTPTMKLKITGEEMLQNPMAFLVSQCTKIREVFWHQIDDAHEEFLKTHGFKPVLIPIYQMLFKDTVQKEETSAVSTVVN